MQNVSSQWTEIPANARKLVALDLLTRQRQDIREKLTRYNAESEEDAEPPGDVLCLIWELITITQATKVIVWSNPQN